MFGLARFVKRKVLLYTPSLLLLVLNVLTISGVELTLLRAREVTFHLELTTPASPIKEVFDQRTNEVTVMLPWVKGVQITMSTQPSRPISNIMAVSSRKGGVEKTTAAVNCAYILASMDAGVGVLAANADGPSLPTMVSPEPRILGMNPECLRVRLGSLGNAGQGRAVTRGPMVSKIISLTEAVIVESSSDGWQNDCVGTMSSSRSLPASTYLERTKSFLRHGALGSSVGTDLSSAAPLNGKNQVGHLVCYNLFGSLRWRIQLREQGITELDFLEKDASYYLTPVGAFDPIGGGLSEETLVMAVATVTHFHHIEDPGDHDNDGQVKDYCHLDNKTIHSDLVVKCNLDVLTDYCNSDRNGEDSIDLKETFLNECQMKIMGEPPDEKPDSNGSEKRLPVCSNRQGSANTLPIREATYVAAEDSCDCEVGDNTNISSCFPTMKLVILKLNSTRRQLEAEAGFRPRPKVATSAALQPPWQPPSALDLSEENVKIVLGEARTELAQMFDTSVGITGEAELAELDGPFVKIRLRGKFWHKRSTVLDRLANYLQRRIPEILGVDIEDDKQLDDSPENF
ncbi:hypothetical protein Nepgr_004538 [Nepenthes gracilis]|uniref:Uncharacterized protein n=1 Tax=Nepenthes gracilis TaxID=150966 RepID=A0AAD3XF90_NEPGR|nr:hypothetical protein Nepgr_004538 [Nepenthes gracilis]